VAADAERSSIERALHDCVQQVLVGLAANLELASRSMDADPSTTKRLLDEMGREAWQAMEETRKLAHRIYPPLLEVGGLVAALRSAASSERVPIRIDVVLDPACPPEIVSTVYFCCIDVIERI
jgi:signal transduction histidine kinase